MKVCRLLRTKWLSSVHTKGAQEGVTLKHPVLDLRFVRHSKAFHNSTAQRQIQAAFLMMGMVFDDLNIIMVADNL